MSLTIKLVRHVARRAANDVVREHLVKAFKFALKQHTHLSLTRLVITATNTGHEAAASVEGRVSEQYHNNFIASLGLTLQGRFSPPWIIVTGKEGEIPSITSNTPVKLAERPMGKVNTDLPADTFSRIYGRGAQIRRLMDAIQIGKDTNWTKRKHSLLSGPPGSGKTELCLTLAPALGQEGESWLWFDATSTSKAGALEQLMKATVLPPILFVEEIEKCPENALRWLLGVMDERGELRRTNYRVGNESKKTPLTLIATVNNVEALKGMDSGAIYSRFGNRIYCPQPNREELLLILDREVHEIGGNPAWTPAAIKFGYDELKIGDCREILNILLCGRDRLLTGDYQRDFIRTLPPNDLNDLGVSKAILEKSYDL